MANQLQLLPWRTGVGQVAPGSGWPQGWWAGSGGQRRGSVAFLPRQGQGNTFVS